MTKNNPTTGVITFDAAELRRLLANGILFASVAKDCLPVLEAVWFDWDGDQLFAVATNRYVLAMETVSLAEASRASRFGITVRDAKRLIALLPRKHDVKAQVTYDPDTNWVEVTCQGDCVRFEGAHGEFIKWQDRKGFEAGESKTLHVASAWLAALAKVDGGSKGVGVKFELSDNPRKPVRATVGPQFTAIVMPLYEGS